MPTRRHHHELRDAAPQRAAHRTRASPATGRTADARTAAPTVTLAPTGRTTRRAPWRAASGAVLGRTPSARSAAAPAHAGAYGDPGPRCGRYVPISRPTGGRSRQALPQPDLPQPRQRKGVTAVAAIERDDPPTIREHVPRRLPVGRGNRMASPRQTRDGTIHTSRTAMFAVAADGRATTDDRRVAAGPSALVTAPHNEPTEAAALRALGVLSRPLRYLGVRCSHAAQRSVRR